MSDGDASAELENLLQSKGGLAKCDSEVEEQPEFSIRFITRNVVFSSWGSLQLADIRGM